MYQLVLVASFLFLAHVEESIGIYSLYISRAERDKTRLFANKVESVARHGMALKQVKADVRQRGGGGRVLQDWL